MHGRIIFINSATGTGLIFGVDRNRYQFRLSDWEEAGIPARNTEVSFSTELYRAVKVKHATGQEHTIDIFPEVAPSPPPPNVASRTAAEKDVSTVMAEDVAGFRNRMEFDEDDDEAARLMQGRAAPDAEIEPLTPGEIFPELAATEPGRPKRAAVASPLFQIAGDKPRKTSSIKYYAIGVVAALILVAIAYIVVHI